MFEYKGTAIYQSYIDRCWTAVFGYGDYVQKKTLEAVKRAVDLRRGEA